MEFAPVAPLPAPEVGSPQCSTNEAARRVRGPPGRQPWSDGAPVVHSTTSRRERARRAAQNSQGAGNLHRTQDRELNRLHVMNYPHARAGPEPTKTGCGWWRALVVTNRVVCELREHRETSHDD